MPQSSEFTGALSTFFVARNKISSDRTSYLEIPNVELRHAEAVIRRMLRRSSHVNDPVCQRVNDAANVIRTALLDTESVRISDLPKSRPSLRGDGRSPAYRLARRIINRISRACRPTA